MAGLFPVIASLTSIGCTVLSIVVLVAGWRRRLADVALAGGALTALSVLMARHAVSGAGWVADPEPASFAGALAGPVATVLALPLLSRAAWTHALLARWRSWTATVLGAVAVFVVAVAGRLGAPSTGVLVAATVLGAIGAAVLVRRQVYLAVVSRRRSGRIAATGTAALMASTLIGPWLTPGSNPAWAVLAVDNLALLAAATAMLVGYRTGRPVAAVIAPVVAHDPLAALDLGLAPEMVAFVGALGRKDRITRDHVVRTSRLALLAAAEAGLPARKVRSVAVGALLHDIGKLVVPSEILGKPAGLTDEEFAVIRTHPEQGERLLDAAPSLADAARFVRWHHERYDGRGYPDKLAHPKLPLEVAIVSASDAWDAMTNTRQYRTGMSIERATDILRAGAGSQWHPTAVEAVLRAAARLPRLPKAPSGTDDSPGVDCGTDHGIPTERHPQHRSPIASPNRSSTDGAPHERSDAVGPSPRQQEFGDLQGVEPSDVTRDGIVERPFGSVTSA